MDDQGPLARKAHLLVKRMGLTREERIELAEYVLRRDLGSWKGLEEADYARLCDVMEGWGLIQALLNSRPPTPPPPPHRELPHGWNGSRPDAPSSRPLPPEHPGS